jgi:hypothetical protein
MPHVRMRGATYSIEHGGRLAAGQLVDVEPETARRWLKTGLAADKDDPAARAAFAQSTDALQAEVARLQAELARMQTDQSPDQGPSLPEGPYENRDELADLDFLTEQQRANLQRAGFGSLAAIRDAGEDELADVDRIGAATVVRLRQAAGAAGA